MNPRTRRVLFWLAVIFIGFVIITAPQTAAEWVRTLIDWIEIALTGLFDFFEALV